MTFPTLPCNLKQYEWVRDDDDDQRREIHDSQVEQVVSNLVSAIREKVEGDALSKPWEFWVFFYVEYHNLKKYDFYAQILSILK